MMWDQLLSSKDRFFLPKCCPNGSAHSSVADSSWWNLPRHDVWATPSSSQGVVYWGERMFCSWSSPPPSLSPPALKPMAAQPYFRTLFPGAARCGAPRGCSRMVPAVIDCRYALNQAGSPMAVSTYIYETLPALEQAALPSENGLSAALDWSHTPVSQG